MNSSVPLVSIVISSYNSGSFIIETLDSIYNQTWSDLELIITDDCSSDDTVLKASGWLKFNQKRFLRSMIITSDTNTGVSSNANRGLRAAKGPWIKFLGADDALKTDCIEKNMSFISNREETKVLFSGIEVYNETFETNNLIKVIPGNPFSPKSIFSDTRTALSQYKMLLVQDRIHFSPSAFIRKSVLTECGGFDENFKLLEDYPLWVKITKAGHRLSFMNEITVLYRMHSNALNNITGEKLVKQSYFAGEEFRKKYTYPFLPLDVKCNQRYTWLVCQIFRFGNLNFRNRFSVLLYNILLEFINPFRYIIWLRRSLKPELANDEFYS